MGFMETTTQFLIEYKIVIGVLILFVGIWMFNKIKNRKKKTKDFPVQKISEETNDFDKTQITNKDKKDENFIKNFLDEENEDEKPFNVIEDIGGITNKMNLNSQAIDKTMENEFENLREELKIITEKRKNIKSYGQQLGKLYDKYGEREKYIVTVMVGIERLLKKE